MTGGTGCVSETVVAREKLRALAGLILEEEASMLPRSASLTAGVLGLVAFGVDVSRPAEAGAPVAVYVHSPARSSVRLRVADGRSRDCDSSWNRPRFDGQIRANETLRIPIGGRCVCLSNTSTGFPESDWNMAQRYCGPGGRFAAPSNFSLELDGR